MEINQSFDVIVIGGGPGGYHAANILAKAGKLVALFEKKNLGGTCLNEGCIPSKTFLKSAKIFDSITHSGEYGIDCENGSVCQEKVVERKNAVVNKLVMGVRGGLRKNKVKLFFAPAQILTAENDSIIVKSEEKIYSAKNLIIATGSKVAIPPIFGLEQALESGFVLTSSNIFDLQDIPKHLVVIGGGIVGIEMATYFNSIGSNVTVVEGCDKICGDLDVECANLLKDNLTSKGIKFITSSFVETITKNGLTIKGSGEFIECDKILLATGRVANVDNLGVENLSLQLIKGAIAVDENMQTSSNGVYAIGDVNGKVMLAHTAYKEAEVCVSHILGGSDQIDYNVIPSVLYCSPECAWVGLKEKDVLENERYAVKKLPMIYSGRFVSENVNLNGFCKLIIDKQNNVLVGATLMGDGVSELIFVLSSFIQLNITVDNISRLIFPHPTLGEIIKETLNS